MKCAYLQSITTPENFKIVTIDNVLQDIKTEKYANSINALPLSSNDKKAYNLAKRHLPAWALNGKFTGGTKNDNFTESNGLFHIDIDGLDSPEAIKWQLAHEIPELYALWISPSGKGLKGLLRIPDDFIHNDSDFKEAFTQIERYLSVYDVAIDKACKDVRRLCFVCSDPDIFINVDAPAFIFDMTTWGKKDVKKPSQQHSIKPSTNQASQQDRYIDRCCNLILQSVSGTHHNARLRAGKLAGGFISAELVDETTIMQALSHASDAISAQYGDSTAIIQREQKTIYDAIQYGKGQPVEVQQYSRTGTDSNVIQISTVSYPPPANEEIEEVEKVRNNDDVQEWNKDITNGINYIIPFDGIARDIQQWILETSKIEQPAIALAATLAVIGVTIGRDIDYDGIKGNLMTVCIAGSGHGKDHPLKCADRLLDSVGMGDRVYSRLASGAALFETVHRHQSCLLQIDEIGHYLGSINDKGSNQFSKEIMPMMTEMYTSASGTFRDKARKGESKKTITAPNLNVIGMTTERQVIDTMKTSTLADGSLARFLVLFGEEPKALNHSIIDKEPPKDLIDKLMALKCSLEPEVKLPSGDTDNAGKGFKSRSMLKNDGYYDEWVNIQNYFFDNAGKARNSGGDDAIFESSWRRAAVMALQVALVIDQCQNIDVLKWSANLIEKSANVFSAKFKHLAADNETERLVKIVEGAIKEAGKKGITKKEFYNKTRQVPSVMKDGILKDLIGADKIMVDDFVKLKGSQRPSTVYYWLK